MKIFKKLFVPALALSALVLNISCDADKLELTNPNELQPDTYWQNAAQVQAAVNACYGAMQTTSMYNRMMWYGNDNMSHENTCNPQQEADKRELLNFSHSSTHGMIYGYWASCYRGINKCNFVINNETKIREVDPAFLTDEMKDKYIGEAKFMRALYYFWLTDKFGDIPLYLDIPEDEQGLGKSPKSAIWAQIEADLADAANKLRYKAKEESGRATKGAAYALLGKARLYQKKYDAALVAFDSVKGYKLEAKYFDNFKEETENGPESIFEVQFNVKAGTSAAWNSDRTDQGLNEGTFRGQEYGVFNWFNVYPSLDLWNEFETDADGKYNNNVKVDPRRAYCIIAPGDLYAGGEKVAVIGNDTVWNDPKDHDAGIKEIIPRRGWNKYQNYYKWDSEGKDEANFSGINMKVIRYADVLLMMAECHALKTPSDLTTAIDLMNDVRERADVDMPLYGSAEMDAIFPVGNVDQFLVALEHERKIELCGEQVRFPDLVRWNRLADFMGSTELLESLPLADRDALLFKENKNELWPIPQVEIDANINLGPEDQNPGY